MKDQRPVHSTLAAILCALLGLAFQAQAQEVPSEYREVLKTLGKQGDFKANVLKVNIPRKDLTAQPFFLRDSPPVLHARDGTRESGRPRPNGEAGCGPDWSDPGSSPRSAASLSGGAARKT